jgi:chaperone BCS1
VRPGRIDVKIEYQLATHEQAQALFERFFPPERFCSKYVQTSSTDADLVKQTRPPMLVSVLADLGRAFAAGVPEGEFSAAELQGFLLTCKWDPEHAVGRIGAWIDVQRAERIARQEKEREAKASAGKRGTKVDAKQTAAADESVAVVKK